MTETAKPADPPVFEPVRSDRTFEIVVERIREKLLAGALRPGDKLPPERELARQLEVSRNVVREALRSLENAGLVRTRQGAHGGAFIREGSPARITQALRDLLTLNAISLDDLFEARVLMLGMVLDRIATMPRPIELSDLQANLAETEAAVAANDSPGRVAAAHGFYHHIAALTGNSALVFTIDAQTELIQTFLRYRATNMDPERLLASRRTFLDHLQRGDFEAAKAELKAHLGRVHDRLWNR